MINLRLSNETVTAGGILDLFDWCAARANVPCDDSVVGLAIAINESILQGPVRDIESKLWKKETHEKWNDWCRAEAGLIEKYADHDNQGNILRKRDGSISIDENRIEFNKELENLKGGEFKDLWDAYTKGQEENKKVLDTPHGVTICTITSFDHCPKDITPRMLSILMGSEVSTLFREYKLRNDPSERAVKSALRERGRDDRVEESVENAG